MNTKPTIVAVHLLNDFSGSPCVLAQSIATLREEGYPVHVLTATGPNGGFLKSSEVETFTELPYRWSNNKLITLVRFLWFQAVLFCTLCWRYRNQNVVVYVNTVLPFAASLFGAIFRKPVVCHLHEATLRPEQLKPLFLFALRKAKARGIFVSQYLQNLNVLPVSEGSIVYNSLSPAFWQTAQANRNPARNKEVLMVSSLKAYKGIFQFIHLASRTPERTFRLVVNADDQAIKAFLRNTPLPHNFICCPGAPSVHPFYQNASVVLNLSLPDGWVETFGLTALEAMAYGLPVVVPPVGGIAEIALDGLVGVHADARNLKALQAALHTILNDDATYKRMSAAATAHAQAFSAEAFSAGINHTFQLVVAEKYSPSAELGWLSERGQSYTAGSNPHYIPGIGMETA